MQKILVYPCGYVRHGALIEWLMMEYPDLLLIDTRKNPHSTLSDWDEKALTLHYQDRYRQAGEYLGNLNYGNDGPILIADPITGIRGLLRYLLEGQSFILLCKCTIYEQCHLHSIMKLLTTTLRLWGYMSSGMSARDARITLTEIRSDLKPLQHIISRIALGFIPRNPPPPPLIHVCHPDTIERPGFLKCISIRQPWSWVILHPNMLTTCGLPAKCIENRSWTTPYRGKILIHAGAKGDPDMFTRDQQLAHSYWRNKFGENGEDLAAHMPQTLQQYPCRAIVGVADLVDIVECSPDPWYVNGSYGFVLSNPQPFDPISYPGQQMLFDIPISAIEPS